MPRPHLPLQVPVAPVLRSDWQDGNARQRTNGAGACSSHCQVIGAADLLLLVFSNLNRLIAAHRMDMVPIHPFGLVIKNAGGMVLLGVLEGPLIETRAFAGI